jgi:hypothetical protein
MIGISRPFGPLLACGGALGVAVAGSLAVGSDEMVGLPTIAALPATVVTALPPLPPPDSLAALLVSSPGRSRFARGETGLLLEALALIEAKRSMSERADLLREVAEMPDLEDTVIVAVAQAAGRIYSPNARAYVLRRLILMQPSATAEARGPILDAIGAMQSSPERAMTLELFVTTRQLDQPALIDALVQIERLRADNERSRVLLAAAGAQRLQGRAIRVYQRAASSIASERYRERAMYPLRRYIRRMD